MAGVDRCEKCGKAVSRRDAQPAKVVREVSAFMGTKQLGGYRVVFHKKCFDPRDRGYEKSAW